MTLRPRSTLPSLRAPVASTSTTSSVGSASRFSTWPALRRRIVACALGAAGTLLGGAVIGSASFANDALRDPTRPPPGYENNAAAGAAQASAAAAEPALLLQSILRAHDSPNGSGTGSTGSAARRPAAIIGGRLVPLGGRIGELTLARIDDGSVRLTGPRGPLTLRLVPDLAVPAKPEASR